MPGNIESSATVAFRIEVDALDHRAEDVQNHFDGFRVFSTDPNVPLDNNRTERALRGVVVARKNHRGSRSERGIQVAAMMYSLVESAKINRVDPELYLELAALEAIGSRTIPLPHQLGRAFETCSRSHALP